MDSSLSTYSEKLNAIKHKINCIEAAKLKGDHEMEKIYNLIDEMLLKIINGRNKNNVYCPDNDSATSVKEWLINNNIDLDENHEILYSDFKCYCGYSDKIIIPKNEFMEFLNNFKNKKN